MVFSLMSVALMAWDWHESFRRMFFDTGAPLWPYQTPTCLLLLFDAPALVLSRLVLGFAELGRIPMTYLVQLPFVVVWWWFVGTRVDFGLMGGRRHRHPRLLATSLSFLVAALILFLGLEVKSEIFYWNYMKSHGWAPELTIRDVLDAGSILWSFVLIVASCLAIRQLLRGGSWSHDAPLVSRRNKLWVASGFTVYTAFVCLVFWHIRRVEAQEQADTDLRSACVQGQRNACVSRELCVD
jgi:hypothetical protein